MATEQRSPRVEQQSAAQRRYRTLAVVKQEAITRVEKPLEDSVFVWPHLLVREFFAATAVTVMVTLLSLAIDAPLQEPATPNSTPLSAKAPCRLIWPTSSRSRLAIITVSRCGPMAP